MDAAARINLDERGYCQEARIAIGAAAPTVIRVPEAEKILQGKKINDWGKNVYVKVPVTNSEGKFMGQVIKTLNNKNIKLNITAVYTAKQTKQILKKINKKTEVIISIFAGRMADTGKDPIPELKKSLGI